MNRGRNLRFDVTDGRMWLVIELDDSANSYIPMSVADAKDVSRILKQAIEDAQSFDKKEDNA